MLSGVANSLAATPRSRVSLELVDAGVRLRLANRRPPHAAKARDKMVPVVGGKYKVRTKTIGSGPVKVLLLHGGPGFTDEYLEAMESFLPQAGMQMIDYDELGCGNSAQPDDPALWTLPPHPYGRIPIDCADNRFD